MQKRHREIRDIVRRAGLSCDSITPGTNGHIRVMTSAPNGEKKTFFMPGTPSDWRSDKNSEADMARFARENPGENVLGALGDALVKAQEKPVLVLEQAGAAATSREPWPWRTPQVPAPAPTPKPPEPAKATKNQLSHHEFYRVCEWLKATDLSTRYTYADVASYAAEALQMDEISPYSVKSAMEAVGKELAKAPDKPAPKDRTRVVARVLADVLRKLGEPVPEDLAAIIGAKAL